MSYPLKDDSGGKLKAMPGGGIYLAGGGFKPTFHPAAPGEAHAAMVVDKSEPPVYCKYCYTDVAPLTLREEVIPGRVTEMTICSVCASGLTPPEVV